MDQSARDAMKQLSTNTLNISGENAGLQQQKQAQAARSLQDIYSGAMGGTLNALGVGNQSINAQTNADQATTGMWMPIVTSAMGGASSYFGGRK
jgi:hypothetical protein